MKQPDHIPPTPAPSPEPLNEAADLRLEASRAKYDERMKALDLKDRAGPHWIRRD